MSALNNISRYLNLRERERERAKQNNNAVIVRERDNLDEIEFKTLLTGMWNIGRSSR